MTEFLIGTGGWTYFNIPGVNPLAAYSKVFNYVEVNSTFYEIPLMERVKAWRKMVPQNFKFSVRCNRRLTHELKFEPVSEAFEILDKMVAICNVLEAEVIHFQTPPYFGFDKTNSERVKDFFASANMGSLRIALEKRNPNPFTLQFTRSLEDLKIIHCVDLLKEEPKYQSDILYTRLFGRGSHNIYQPLDNELGQVNLLASRESVKKALVTFHFVRMYKDAIRFKIYKETGEFPMVTKSTGVSSLEEVLREDARFPAAKRDLLVDQGWKIIDLTATDRVRAADLLQRLPEKNYNGIGDIVHTLGNLKLE